MSFAIFDFYRRWLFPLLSIGSTWALQAIAYALPLRWVPKDRMKLPRRVYFWSAVICSGLKMGLYQYSILHSFPPYPYLSELIAWFFMTITIITICRSFEEFCSLHCFYFVVNCILFLLPDVLLFQKLRAGRYSLLLVYQEFAAAGQIASASQLFKGLLLILTEVLLNLLLLWVNILILDPLMRYRQKLPPRQYRVGYTASFVIYMCLRLFSFFAVVKSDGIPQPDLLQMIWTTFLSFFLLIILDLYFRLKGSFFRGRTHALLAKMQADELRQVEEMTDKLLSYFDRVEQQLNQLEAEIRAGIADPPSAEFDATLIPRYADNPIANAVLSWCDHICRERGIAFSVSGNLPKETGLPPQTEASIYHNLLKNAFEGADSIARSPEDGMSQTPPYVLVDFRSSAGNLLIRVVNNYDASSHTPKRDPLGQIISRKEERDDLEKRHGYGLKILTFLAEENGGHFELSFDETKHEAEAVFVVRCSGKEGA